MRMNDEEVLLTVYNAGLAEKERCTAPIVGYLTDRRLIKHANEVFSRRSCHGLDLF